jgi:prophage DNA circulation protein
MSVFEVLEPKSQAHYDVFGNELVKLLQGLSSSPHYKEISTKFITATLNAAPSTHKAFEKALIAAIQAKDSVDKAAREKAEGKQRGLGKFRGFAKQVEDADEDETSVAVQQVYTEEELAAIAEAQLEEDKREMERQEELEKSRAAELARRLANEELLLKNQRKVDAAAAAKTLADQGFEIIAPAWDDKKKGGKKGKR